MSRVMHIGWERGAGGFKPVEAYFLTRHRKTTRPAHWTEAHDDLLRRYAADRLPAQAVADELGRSRSSILGRAHRLGVQFKSIARAGQPAREARPKTNGAFTYFGPATPRIAKVKMSQNERREAKSLAPAEGWTPKRVSVFDLVSSSCRWPLWKAGAAFSEKLYCGADALPGNAYCGHCYGLSIEPRQTRHLDKRLGIDKARAA